MDKQIVLQIAICEDTATDMEHLLSHIETSGICCQCHSFESGEDFLKSFHTGKYDLIFMDIYMAGIRGIETVKAIRETDTNVPIAFTTTSLDHALDSYRLGVLKYLEKPVDSTSVRETLELALMTRKSRPTLSITLTGGIEENIPLDNILYFEQQRHVIDVHLTDCVLTTSQSIKMDQLEDDLPSPPFLRCHRSFLVNLNYVHKADSEKYAFIMKNGDRADIRRGEFANCKTELNKLRILKMGGDKI